MKIGVLTVGIISLVLILTANFVLAADNMNLKISGTINNLTSDIMLKTSSKATSGLEGYDLKASNILLPDTYSQFYSTSTGNNLVIDSWNRDIPNIISHDDGGFLEDYPILS